VKVAVAELVPSDALTAYGPAVVVGIAKMAVNLPSPPTVTVPGTVDNLVPAQDTVTVAPAAKLLPPTSVAAMPLAGLSVTAAGAGGAERAVRFRLVTSPAVQVADCVAV